MPKAILTIQVPEDLWIGTITRDFPEATFRVLAALPGDDTGVGLVEVSAPDLPSVVRAFDDAEEVGSLNLLRRHDDTALVQFETTEPRLLFPIVGSGIPLELPFTMADGTANWEITTSQDRLSSLGEQLEAFNIDFTVEEIRYHLQTEQLLTDRQSSLIQTAVESGYYDTPRECTLTELADREGLAKSTASETLHRAEGKIIKEFLSNEASNG
ncbi:MAG: helix-turn-helix domain-containing protein [Halodesulfurarchaeum sp.]